MFAMKAVAAALLLVSMLAGCTTQISVAPPKAERASLVETAKFEAFFSEWSSSVLGVAVVGPRPDVCYRP